MTVMTVSPAITAHPRSRGENWMPLHTLETICGSSPLTRGKPNDHSTNIRDDRLIPAHAGKTPPRAGTRVRFPAHPRSRGENRALFYGAGEGLGSSPLTRGKLLGGLMRGSLYGLIPAHAGKTIRR